MTEIERGRERETEKRKNEYLELLLQTVKTCECLNPVYITIHISVLRPKLPENSLFETAPGTPQTYSKTQKHIFI